MAFMDLVACRPGWGDGPIPFTAIMDYARAFDFDMEQAEDLQYYVSALDEAYMGHVRRKSKASTSSKSKPAKGKS